MRREGNEEARVTAVSTTVVQEDRMSKTGELFTKSPSQSTAASGYQQLTAPLLSSVRSLKAQH